MNIASHLIPHSRADKESWSYSGWFLGGGRIRSSGVRLGLAITYSRVRSREADIPDADSWQAFHDFC